MVRPAGSSAATRVADGADQPAGIAIGPIVFARPMLTVIALGMPPSPVALAAPLSSPSPMGPSAGEGPERPAR